MRYPVKLTLATVATLLLAGGFVRAQDLGIPRPGDVPLEAPEFLPEKLPKLFELPPVPPPPEEAPVGRDIRFVLRGINLQGSTVLTDTDLSGIVELFLGREVGITELLEIRRQITLLYIDRGYINSGAVLPDQPVENGIVTMVAVEGSLTDVKIEGNDQFAAEFIRRRIARGTEAPLNINKLRENALILLQRPNIKRLNVELGPGTRPGESDLTVKIEEQKRVVARLGFSNERPPSVGAEQGEVGLTLRNVTGWGDATNLQFQVTEGLEDYLVDFSIPVTSYDTTLSITGEFTDSEVVEEPFNALDVESESNSIEIALRHPFWRTPSRELAARLSFARRRSQTFLLGQPFAFSEGVDSDGESVVTVGRAAFDFLDRSANRVVALRSTFSLGVDAFDATDNPGSIPDGEYFAWLGQLQWVQRIGSTDARAILRTDAQLTPDRLLPLEKFAVGGAHSVRGYRENRLVRDNGVAASLEFRVPLIRLPIPGLSNDPADGTVELAPFFDYGRSWDNDGGLNDNLYSVGVGLLWSPSEHLHASIYYGKDLKELPAVGDDDDLQDLGVHFQITLELFN